LVLLSYPVILADDGFGTVYVLCPDIPEAMTYAATREEAAAKARDALEGALDLYRIEGRPIPRPGRTKGDIVVSLLTQDLGFAPETQTALPTAAAKRPRISATQRLQRLFSLKRLKANVEY
jgi:predicted RNase H-like HicB family nuclease